MLGCFAVAVVVVVASFCLIAFVADRCCRCSSFVFVAIAITAAVVVVASAIRFIILLAFGCRCCCAQWKKLHLLREIL